MNEYKWDFHISSWTFGPTALGDEAQAHPHRPLCKPWAPPQHSPCPESYPKMAAKTSQPTPAPGPRVFRASALGTGSISYPHGFPFYFQVWEPCIRPNFQTSVNRATDKNKSKPSGSPKGYGLKPTVFRYLISMSNLQSKEKSWRFKGGAERSWLE